MTDRETIEKALDAGRLMVRMSNGNLWRARRNGRTVTWKTRPDEFRIPIKMGLKSYAQITEINVGDSAFVIEA